MLLETAVARARRLAALTPADTFQLTKEQLRAAVPAPDPRVEEIWVRAVEDGRLRRYMDSAINR